MKINSAFVLIFLLQSFSTLWAQESLVGSGGNAIGASGSVSYSVGQVVYTTINGTTGTVFQGVQQPFEISINLSTIEASKIDLIFSAYPNPTAGFLTLNVSDYNLDALSYQLFDSNGRFILKEKISSIETQISLEKFPSACYLIKILDQNASIKTFKIIKN
jgi:Secretion system C-terminal sorting domain